MGAHQGTHMCTRRMHIYVTIMGTLWVPIWAGCPTQPINGCPSGHPYVGHPTGVPHYCLFYFGRSSTRLRLIPGSNGHPLMGAHMHTLRVCIINVCAWKDVTFGWDNPFGVNFSLNYRDLGQNLRIIFYLFTGHTSWASMGTLRAPIWVPLWGTHSPSGEN